jgi:hypothetical protein
MVVSQRQLEVGLRKLGNNRVVSKEEKEDKESIKHSLILSAAAGGKLETTTARVAWVLNHYPETRDSDIALQLKYWECFNDYSRGAIYPEDLYKLPRLTTLSRARAYIQNVHKLFLASPEVRKQRGTLEEEEKEKAIKQRPSYPIFVIYADESGKTGDHLIVGSIWFLYGYETYRISEKIREWREQKSFKDEFHFKNIGKYNFPLYIEIAEMISKNSNVISFKAISVERSGTKDIQAALSQLYYHLLIRGVEHEDKTGTFAAASQVARLMEECERGPLREFTPCRFDTIEKTVKALAVVHTELVLIHPFRDGNGRVARLLATLMALQAELPPLDFGSLKGYRRKAYYAAIRAGLDRDDKPMEDVFNGVIRKTLRKRKT